MNEPARSQSAAEAVDANTVADLRDVGGEEFVKEIFQEYLEDTSDNIQKLQHALDDANQEAAGVTAHTLKGASNNVGALALGKLCFDLERLAKSQDELAIDEALGLLAKIADEFGRVRNEIEAQLSV